MADFFLGRACYKSGISAVISISTQPKKVSVNSLRKPVAVFRVQTLRKMRPLFFYLDGTTQDLRLYFLLKNGLRTVHSQMFLFILMIIYSHAL